MKLSNVLIAISQPVETGKHNQSLCQYLHDRDMNKISCRDIQCQNCPLQCEGSLFRELYHEAS